MKTQDAAVAQYCCQTWPVCTGVAHRDSVMLETPLQWILYNHNARYIPFPKEIKGHSRLQTLAIATFIIWLDASGPIHVVTTVGYGVNPLK